jgi:hypothetical protein
MGLSKLTPLDIFIRVSKRITWPKIEHGTAGGGSGGLRYSARL